MAKTTGRLSNKHKSFINANAGKLTSQQIAAEIGKSEDAVKMYLIENGLWNDSPSAPLMHDGELRLKLHNKAYYDELMEHFTLQEMKTFEQMWVDLMKQFKQDVLPTEEYQIKQFITTEILMNRTMRERKRCLQDCARTERLILEAEDRQKKAASVANADRIKDLNDQVINFRQMTKYFTDEYTKLAGDKQKLLVALKASREQRVKVLEDSKQNFVGLLKALDDEAIVEDWGMELAAHQKSTEKEYKRLGDYWEYADGVVDQPVLSSQTIKDE